jgi:hypothetical protein
LIYWKASNDLNEVLDSLQIEVYDSKIGRKLLFGLFKEKMKLVYLHLRLRFHAPTPTLRKKSKLKSEKEKLSYSPKIKFY